MTAYLDTSALMKLYYPEPESPVIARWVVESSARLVWTPLHHLEMAMRSRSKSLVAKSRRGVGDRCSKSLIVTHDERQGELASTVGLDARRVANLSA